MNELSLESPQDYGLDHNAWRPHQRETLDWGRTIARGGVGVLEAPTGSGKTALPAAISARATVISLVQHKHLQQVNYGEKYGFDVLYGKSNYDCVHPANLDIAGNIQSAEACIHESNMLKCPYASECPYVIARERAKESSHASLNYPYWFTARWLRTHTFSYLVCDEAHNLSEQVLEFTGCTVNEFIRAKYGLPSFPQAYRVQDVSEWFEDAIARLNTAHYKYRGYPKEQEKIKRLGAKLDATVCAMDVNASDWYVRSGQTLNTNPQLVARPLTARYHFAHYFLSPHYRLIAMSATIGDMPTFTKELGISEYESRRVPSVWDASVRPVIIPNDIPRMGYTSTSAEKTAQALRIAREVKKYPSDWSGVVHVSSKQGAKDLAVLLSRFGLSERIWVPTEGRSTEQVAADWTLRKQKVIGSLAVAWAWQEGVDLTEERICIVAKVQFPSLGDDYEKARMGYDGQFYLQRTAWKVEQSLGRTRRGEASDYNLNGEISQLVMIADGNWTRVKKYLSQNLKDSIVVQ